MSSPYLDGSYARAHPGWHGEDAPEKAAGIISLLDHLDWRPRTIVDVGCGTGDVLRELVTARPSWTATGFDISADAISRGSPTAAVSLRVGEADISADLCLCLDVAEHVPDDVGFLRSLHARAPRHIIRLPLDLSALDILRPHRMLAARRELGHLHMYTRVTATERVREAGFRIVHVEPHRVRPATTTHRQRLVDGVRRLAFRWSPNRAIDLLGGWSLLIAAETGTR